MNLLIGLLFNSVISLAVVGGIIAAAIWVYRDAKSKKSGWASLWAVMVLVAFIPCFPLYFWKRSIDESSGPSSTGSRVIFGIAIMVFVLPLAILGFALSRLLPLLTMKTPTQNAAGGAKNLSEPFRKTAGSGGTYIIYEYSNNVLQSCFEYSNLDSDITAGIKKTCNKPTINVTCVIQDNAKCASAGAKLECERPAAEPNLPYKSIFYRDIGGWPTSFKKEQCKGQSMDSQIVTPTSSDKLKGQIHLTQYKYSQLAMRSVYFRIPSKTLDYKAIENPLPAHAEGPFSSAQQDSGDFKDPKKLPPKLIEWIPKVETPSVNGPSTFYKSLECISNRSEEFPTAKYILSENGGSSMLSSEYMYIKVTQRLLVDFDTAPQWLVEACDKKLKSAPQKSGIFVASKFSVINPLLAPLVEPNSKLSPKEMKEQIDNLYKNDHLSELFSLVGSYQSNFKAKFLALLKLAEEDRLSVLTPEIAYLAPKNQPEFETLLGPIFKSGDSKKQLRLKPFEEALFSPAIFSSKYPTCQNMPSRDLPQIKLINGEFKSVCGKTSPDSYEYTKKYTVPVFCDPKADLKIDLTKTAPPPYNLSDSCHFRDDSGGTSPSCLSGYKLDRREGPDQCVPL